MNEQQLADLFSEQLDQILAGKTIAAPVEELSGLLNLGQQLTQVRFQASPAAQAAFQGQVTSWFGSAGGAGLGLSKGLLMAIMMVVGTGIGLVALVSSLLGGDLPGNSNPQVPDTSLPAMATPVETSLPIETPPATSIPVAPTTESVITSSEGDTLPAFSTLGDTVLTGTVAITVTRTQDIFPLLSTTATTTPTIALDDNQPDGEDEDNPSGMDDHDRGHGNDLDGVDEDNPGNSSGVGSGNDKDKKNEGKGEGKKK